MMSYITHTSQNPPVYLWASTPMIPVWMLLIQVEWNGQKCVRQCKLTLVILFIFVLFKDKYYRINFQRDSNSDRQSRRRVRCTLDHHHGPSSVGIFNSTISNVPPWAHPFLQLRDDCMITFKRQNKRVELVFNQWKSVLIFFLNWLKSGARH